MDTRESLKFFHSFFRRSARAAGFPKSIREKQLTSKIAFLLLVFLISFSQLNLTLAYSGNQGNVQSTGRLAYTSPPSIYAIETNQMLYQNKEIPQFDRFEITFQLDTVAQNLQIPYDPTPPPGIQPGQGVRVDALFTNDNWKTIYTQPAFYYQYFEDRNIHGDEWFYPQDRYAWKVRFSPHRPGAWQFRLVAEDAGGKTVSDPQKFVVTASQNQGFVRVSSRDPRYFEFDNGAFFQGLGYNMNFDGIDWSNPWAGNQANFASMSNNGIQLVRMWLSQWAIRGSSWNPWNSVDPAQHGMYIPYTGLTFDQAYPGSEVSLRLDADENPCMFIGAWKARPAVKPNTAYRVRIRYLLEEVSGPGNGAGAFGLVAKTGRRLGLECAGPGTGTVVTPYASTSTGNWQILEGRLVTGASYFLPFFYLALENVSRGRAYVDYVWVEEDLGGGNFGPNILPKPWMAHHLYFEQRNSYAFDKLVTLAEKHGIFLKVVIDEKKDWYFNRIDERGNIIPDNPLCKDRDPENDPAICPGSEWFYGNGRETNKVRWYQQAWWRYLQARWGYSTSIHSWELLNEGDPQSVNHYLLADEFGKYMDQFSPNDHLVTTSFWHSFPNEAFWSSPAYPHIDFATLHRYIEEHDDEFADTALAVFNTSMKYGALQPQGAVKPVIWGEVGFVRNGFDGPTRLFASDEQALWLHNFIWAGINPGGMFVSYWYEDTHIYNRDAKGVRIFDYRFVYAPFANFFKGIPLNNGNYEDAKASTMETGLRAWGQKDLQNGWAHLWIQNTGHTWKNVAAGKAVLPVSGEVEVQMSAPSQRFIIEWWDPYQPNASLQNLRSETVLSRADGTVALQVPPLTSDLAVKIKPVSPFPP